MSKLILWIKDFIATSFKELREISIGGVPFWFFPGPLWSIIVLVPITPAVHYLFHFIEPKEEIMQYALMISVGILIFLMLLLGRWMQELSDADFDKMVAGTSNGSWVPYTLIQALAVAVIVGSFWWLIWG